MYTVFYVLAYLSLLGFVCLACLKMWDFIKASPLHVRWELYPVPHEGPNRAAYGGSYMQESDWWTKPRHVDHWMDIKAMVLEILFLHSTYEHKPKLWLRSYPFHMGLYLWMGGTFLLLFAVILVLCGVNPVNGFMIFLSNLINAVSLFGAFLMVCGGSALLHLRLTDKGLHKYTTREFYFNLGAFVTFGALTLCAWVFNPSYYLVAGTFLYNLFTLNFQPLGSFWFVVNMLAGFVVLLWIPITNMKHLLIKYFMYHDIRWADEATVWSEKNQELINKNLQYPVTWAAPHIADSHPKNWVDVATTNITTPEK